MTTAPAPRLFCFGLGFSAIALARRLEPRGFTIVGTSRDPEAKRQELIRELGHDPGWELVAYDADREQLDETKRALAGTTHLLHSIRPEQPATEGAICDPVLRDFGDFIDALMRAGTLQWIGYLSTTGVYGDHGSAWVNENAERRPSKPRTVLRVQAEDAWLARGAHVFRLAGIYGPGRSALERIESGRARRIVKPGKVFNRIHVEDIARVLEASIDRPNPGRAYNVADGHPASSAEVLGHAAELLRYPQPPEIAFAEADMSAMEREFWEDDVCIDNTRIRSELGVELAYPDYRAGLQACLAARRSTTV